MWINWTGTVIQGGMTRVAVDLTEIICRRYESSKRNKQRTGTYTYQIIHVDIFVLLSGSVIILISSIESNISKAIERLLN